MQEAPYLLALSDDECGVPVQGYREGAKERVALYIMFPFGLTTTTTSKAYRSQFRRIAQRDYGQFPTCKQKQRLALYCGECKNWGDRQKCEMLCAGHKDCLYYQYIPADYQCRAYVKCDIPEPGNALTTFDTKKDFAELWEKWDRRYFNAYYAFGRVGENSCPPNYRIIGSLFSCRNALRSLGFNSSNWAKVGIWSDRPAGCMHIIGRRNIPMRKTKFTFNDHPEGEGNIKYAPLCIKSAPALKCNSRPDKCPRSPIGVPISRYGYTTHYPTYLHGPEASWKRCAPVFYSGKNATYPHFDDVCFGWKGSLSEARHKCNFDKKCAGLFDYGANFIRREDNGLGPNTWRYCSAQPRAGNAREAWVPKPGTCTVQHFNPQEHGLIALTRQNGKEAYEKKWTETDDEDEGEDAEEED